jgi:hypothetical protein
MRAGTGAVSKTMGFDVPKKGHFVIGVEIGRKVDVDF